MGLHIINSSMESLGKNENSNVGTKFYDHPSLNWSVEQLGTETKQRGKEVSKS